MDYRLEGKFSALGFCSGAVVGLVAITPASGYVGPAASVAFGAIGSIICNLACKLKHAFDYDDALDVFAVHGVGGLVGDILTGIFAESYISALDGATPLAAFPPGLANGTIYLATVTPLSVIPGGWLNGHWIQVGHQLGDGCAGMTYSFVVTYLILFIMDKIPGLSLRVDAETEIKGLDAGEIGELAYYHVDKVLVVDPKTHETKLIEKDSNNRMGDPSLLNNV